MFELKVGNLSKQPMGIVIQILVTFKFDLLALHLRRGCIFHLHPALFFKLLQGVR